jgi:hypothetical protein
MQTGIQLVSGAAGQSGESVIIHNDKKFIDLATFNAVKIIGTYYKYKHALSARNKEYLGIL